jgi:membrane protein DedA with SNARE-associated domain
LKPSARRSPGETLFGVSCALAGEGTLDIGAVVAVAFVAVAPRDHLGDLVGRPRGRLRAPAAWRVMIRVRPWQLDASGCLR